MNKKSTSSGLLDALLYSILMIVAFICFVITIFLDIIIVIIKELGDYLESGFDGFFKGIFGHRASDGKFYYHKETPEEYRKRKGK